MTVHGDIGADALEALHSGCADPAVGYGVAQCTLGFVRMPAVFEFTLSDQRSKFEVSLFNDMLRHGP